MVTKRCTLHINDIVTSIFLFLLLVGDRGKVITFERRERFYKRAQTNYHNWISSPQSGMTDNVTFNLGDVKEANIMEQVDAVSKRERERE